MKSSVKLFRPVPRTWRPKPITSSSMKIGDFRPPVVADFTKRSVSFTRIILLSLPNHRASQGGSRAGSKMLSTEFCGETEYRQNLRTTDLAVSRFGRENLEAIAVLNLQGDQPRQQRRGIE